MTASTVDHIVSRRAAFRSPVVLMLQAVVVTLMVFPSSTVLKAVGGGGYVAGLVAYFTFAAYIGVTLFGLHNPLDYRYPVRFALCTLWLVALASYALMNRALMSSTQLLGADRWLIQLAGISGVILVASEFLRSLEDIHRVLRALNWGGAFCGIVAALQFWLKLNIVPYLRLPGFTLNQILIAIGNRNGINRVMGTATDQIELGVVAGMLLPLAIYMAMHDVERSWVWRWLPVPFIALAVPVSVSRSGTLSAVLGLGVLIVCLPPVRRLNAIAAIPVAVAFIFLTAHRLLGTLKAYFFVGTADSSISHRVDNYPYALHLVSQAPWFGQGGGTYVSGNYTDLFQSHILDNQYLDTVIELGVLGLAALVFYCFWPIVAALAARGRSSDPRLRDLSAALAGSALSALVCSVFFDSLSYPKFVYVQALVVGLVGAVWLLVDRENVVARNTRALYPGNRKVGRSLSTDSEVFRLRWRN